MALIYHNWLNLNENRNYPIADLANKKDDDGNFLPDNILIDANIKFPNNLNIETGAVYKALYISAVSITRNIITLVFLGVPHDPRSTPDTIWSNKFSEVFGDPEDSGPSFIPIAAVTIPKPIIPYKNYPVKPLSDGVSGWIMLGSGVNKTDSLTLRYSDSSQTILSPKAAYNYKPADVTSISKPNILQQLSGMVKIEGRTDVSAEIKTINFLEDAVVVPRKVLMLELATEGNNKYVGECNTRVESGECSDTVISTINGVMPDCDGNLTITWSGVTDSIRVSSSAYSDMWSSDFSVDFGNDAHRNFGIILDSYFGSDEICVTALADASGNLPGTGGSDLCIIPEEDPAALRIVSIDSSESFIDSSDPVTFTVRLNRLAPVGGFLVALGTDNYDFASLPATATVLEGTNTITFDVTFTQDADEREIIIYAADGEFDFRFSTSFDVYTVQDTVIVLPTP